MLLWKLCIIITIKHGIKVRKCVFKSFHFIKNSYYKILIPVSTLLIDRKSFFFFLIYQSQKILKTGHLMASTVFDFIWKIVLGNTAFPLTY